MEVYEYLMSAPRLVVCVFAPLPVWAHTGCCSGGPQIEREESWLSLGEEEQRALPLTVPGSI